MPNILLLLENPNVIAAAIAVAGTVYVRAANVRTQLETQQRERVEKTQAQERQDARDDRALQIDHTLREHDGATQAWKVSTDALIETITVQRAEIARLSADNAKLLDERK